jgi:hypothetical protein
MAKMVKKKMARTSTPPSCATEDKRVEMSTFIDGIVVSVLSGRMSLKVLILLTDFIYGISVSSDETTTMKSSQFHASLR